MPVKVCELHHIKSLDQLFDELSRQLRLPAHFGRNLDALYDSLAKDVPGPFEIVWRETEEARKALGADLYATILEILETVAEERGDVTLDIHH
ncbi:ribonuclease inhibitor [Chromobacterium alkanivorans]|jgi:ribonuclease inhibitor|uniref:barstar family protein n=1 Tax=Chromobacterium TaxID=535 RepID=UPI000654A3E9|nr:MULTISPECIES: barstar family protein [Chromobacterium]KMN83478.1 barnase inhibitor [Chromobacterium sp. LK11]MBN3005049.1 barstar family protein [Chromobacterium alkanivorans]MCS3806070.1 ribonuclease inhibitor [Chromobacterium alkanivorans]MCS3820528.1 ribonuclease inhibitor [Chromobacterium alkanivorans]MCS3875286.1 ribonuclease inhibitor [Chromobacterium alkanivorans]